jgi:hypothetical protein
VHALADVPQFPARGGHLVPHLVHLGADVRGDADTSACASDLAGITNCCDAGSPSPAGD